MNKMKTETKQMGYCKVCGKPFDRKSINKKSCNSCLIELAKENKKKFRELRKKKLSTV
jgi:hypothetical protein